MYRIINEKSETLTINGIKTKGVAITNISDAKRAMGYLSLNIVIALDENTNKYAVCHSVAEVEEFYNPPCERCGGSGWLITKKHGIDPNYPTNLPDSGWPTDYLAKEACPLCTASIDNPGTGTATYTINN